MSTTEPKLTKAHFLYAQLESTLHPNQLTHLQDWMQGVYDIMEGHTCKDNHFTLRADRHQWDTLVAYICEVAQSPAIAYVKTEGDFDMGRYVLVSGKNGAVASISIISQLL